MLNRLPSLKNIVKIAHTLSSVFTALVQNKGRNRIFTSFLGVLQVHSLQVDWGAGLGGPHSGPFRVLRTSAGVVSCRWGHPQQHGRAPVQVLTWPTCNSTIFNFLGFTMVCSVSFVICTQHCHTQDGLSRRSCRSLPQSLKAKTRLSRSQGELLSCGQLAGGALALLNAKRSGEEQEVPAGHPKGRPERLQHCTWHRYWHWDPWVRCLYQENLVVTEFVGKWKKIYIFFSGCMQSTPNVVGQCCKQLALPV